MPVTRFRLRMSRLTRVLRGGLLGMLGGCFVPALIDPATDPQWRLLCLVGLVSAIYGLRIVVGPALLLSDEGLVVLNRWPLRRAIPWYRIYEVQVVPGYWMIDLELNSGEIVSLPCVEDVDLLYDEIQQGRERLDA